MEQDTKIPKHVSIIMDGNGRWAKEKGKERVFGHIEGVKSVRVCVETAARKGIKYLSLFAFSEENWARPESEVSTLMNLMAKSIRDEYDTLMKNSIRLIVLGNRSRLGLLLNKSVDYIMEKTKNNTSMTMVVFLSYSGKWDIFEAAKKFAVDYVKDPKTFSIESFDKYLVTADIPEPDLIIRTSGEKRLSNYMLWQAAYSELYFTDTLWPDFRKDEFEKALKDYARRDRRYGKVK